MTSGIVIVGGGLGALRTAQSLRDAGAQQGITLLSAEDTLPYDRPPLSKAYLLGERAEEDLALETAERLSELDITVRLGARVTGLDLSGQAVELVDGERVPFDDLVVATGARPNRLAVLEGLDDALYLRDLDTARRLRTLLGPDVRVGIVGGGFIGLEIASVARKLGGTVTVIEAAPTPLAPIIGEELGGRIRAWHEDHGIEFRCGAAVVGYSGDPGAHSLQLAGGEALEVDVVVVGVGVTPEVDWLAAGGLETHHGLVVDPDGRTSDPHVFGVGDVTCRHVAGACTRSGHWTATNEHARSVAAALLGLARPSGPTQPGYFWSDQFGKRLQFAGRLPSSPRVELLSGTFDDAKFVVRIMDGDTLAAVFSLDSVRDFIKATIPLRTQPAAAGDTPSRTQASVA